ncbi:helix-turn-helix domain-containing protein [Brevibacterium casei]
MNYRPPRKSALVAPVSQRVAVVLAAWLPDSQIFQRTATMPEDLRAEVLDTMDAIKAAATMHKQAFAEVGNRPAAIIPEPEESEAGQMPDPTGVLLPVDADTAAGLLGCGTRRVRQLCKSGDLKAEKHGVSWMIDRESINQYLAVRNAA